MGYPPASPQPPFDPANPQDPRYDPRRDPRNDPRWQREQRRQWERVRKAQADAFREQNRAAGRAQAAAYRAQAERNREQWRVYRRANRRSSIIGPLLLIAIGVLFLLIRTGRLGWLPFLNWYAHWWPLLLIGVGVLRLGEWALDRVRGGATPAGRYTVGSGVGAAVVLLIATGLGLHAAQENSFYGWHSNGDPARIFPFSNREDLQQFFGSKHEEESPAETHSILPAAELSIDNPRGEVTVAGTSDDGKLHLSVHKEVYSNSDDAAAERLERFRPTFSGSDSSVQLRVPSLEGATADLSILVPSGVRLRVNSNRGDVHITNLKAAVTVASNNGDVDIAAITGDVSAHVNHRGRSLTVRSVTGAVDVQGSGDEVNLSEINGTVHVGGDFFGGGHLQHITGPVQYNTQRMRFTLARLDGEIDMDERDSFSASEITGPLSVETHSRNITLTRVAGETRVTNNHGDVEIVSVPPTGNLSVDNHNGAVTLTLPEKSRFTISADTSDGDVTTDFPGLAATEGSRGSLRGIVNGGGPTVRITTSHGDIVLHRNSEPPLPPSPPSPRLTGYGTVPVPPAPPGTLSADSLKSIEDAKHAASAARDEARHAVKEASAEAQRAAREARDEARRAAAPAPPDKP